MSTPEPARLARLRLSLSPERLTGLLWQIVVVGIAIAAIPLLVTYLFLEASNRPEIALVLKLARRLSTPSTVTVRLVETQCEP